MSRAYPHGLFRTIECSLLTGRYVVELTAQWGYGRIWREVHARGKAPTWRELQRDGPTWRGVVNVRGMSDRVEELRSAL